LFYFNFFVDFVFFLFGKKDNFSIIVDQVKKKFQISIQKVNLKNFSSNVLEKLKKSFQQTTTNKNLFQ
jgi:FKBP-type peptidyl-prolyl cis-trans isomerase (trigger factor)